MIGTRPLLRLIRQNLRRNLRSLLLSAFGIVVGIAAFVFFWGLSQGVSQVVLGQIFPIDRVEVISPKTTLTGVPKRIDDALVARIRARPEVEAAFPKMKMAFPARGNGRLLSASMGFEVGGFTDGIDPVLVEGDEGAESFRDWDAIEPEPPACAAPPARPCDDPQRYCAADNRCRRRVPVLVSRTLLELYNGSFAPAHGLPSIGKAQEAFLQGQMKTLRFTMSLGESYLGGARAPNAPPARVEAQLAGISTKAMPIGMTVPIGYIRRWNQTYAGADAARSYSSIVVDLRAADELQTFIPYVKSEGYDTEESQAERIALVIAVVTALFLFIAGVICFISAVNIAQTFFMLVSERRREIGLMRSVGASRGDIGKIILGEAAALGLCGGVVGVLLAVALARTVDVVSRTALPDFPFKPETYFVFSPWLFVAAVSFAAIFCVLGAALPARRAARIHPAQALSG